jgi:glyoxylase-like metal-dependent hydrolase (beta-lactamase superfamily II)
MQVWAVAIEGVSDGSIPVPPTPMFNKTDQDWLQHSQFLDEDGMLPIEMGGFLVRSDERLVLVDTGIGPHAALGRTGTFMANLAALGVRPSDITDVVLTHLHFDHLGWSSDGEHRLFDEATYRCHEADWEFFMGTTPFDDSQAVSLMGGRTSAELLPPILDRLETWSEDGTILPGLDVCSAPGHTPGSTVIVISSDAERAMLLGDVVHCPAELLSNDWEMIGDVDRQLGHSRGRDPFPGSAIWSSPDSSRQSTMDLWVNPPMPSRARPARKDGRKRQELERNCWSVVRQKIRPALFVPGVCPASLSSGGGEHR